MCSPVLKQRRLVKAAAERLGANYKQMLEAIKRHRRRELDRCYPAAKPYRKGGAGISKEILRQVKSFPNWMRATPPLRRRTSASVRTLMGALPCNLALLCATYQALLCRTLATAGLCMLC